jgi:signal transduction histidine kinase
MQVLENLVSNAVKYTLDGGSVTITAGQHDDLFRISVKDTGIGMSEEDQSHLFEGFFRASSVKRKFEGTGLGLSLVQGIVKAHSGHIWVESALGEGSTFHVDLPLDTTD